MQNYRLGDYIRQRRQELNLTQEQVCAGICEPVTLSRFENGRQTPSRTRIVRNVVHKTLLTARAKSTM